MAPEQAEGSKGRITTLTDVYGLGAVLYALLTGRAPFVADTLLETIEQVRTTEPVPPTRLQPKLPRDLETICLKCLEKDPNPRYAAAEDLAVDLRRWLDGKPIQARRVGPMARAWLWCRRNRSVAAFLVVITVFAGVSTWQWVRADGLLHQARRSSCEKDIDKAIELCRQGEVGRGLLELARTLRNTPSWSEDLGHAIDANIAAWAPYATGLKAVLPHESQVYFATYSPDGRTILTLSSGRGFGDGDELLHTEGEARLWRAETGERLGGPLSKGPTILWASFSPDSQMLATCGNDGAIRFWQAATGTPLGDALHHGGLVLCAAFSADGRTLLTGSNDHTARLWDVATRRPIGAPLQHGFWVTHVGFGLGPESGVIMTGCQDGVVRLWNARTQELISEKPRIHKARSDKRPTRALFAVSGDGTRRITNRARRLFPQPGDPSNRTSGSSTVLTSGTPPRASRSALSSCTTMSCARWL
jgi:hypothetical protein